MTSGLECVRRWVRDFTWWEVNLSSTAAGDAFRREPPLISDRASLLAF